jgi:hypothetical protein
MNNHVWLAKRVNATEILLTPADERKKIRELLGRQFDHAGKLFKPDGDFYELADDENLQQSARQLFMWLGIKPGHLEIKYGQLPQPGIYTEDPGMRRIIINQKLASYPFQCAAVLTHLVMHSIVAGKRRYVLSDPIENETFINLAIIESGMALAVVNGLSPVHLWQKLRLKSDISPDSLFPRLDVFMDNFAYYIQSFRIHHEEYANHLAPWVEKLLPTELYERLVVRNPRPEFINKATNFKQRLFIKFVTFIFTMLLVLVAGYFMSTDREQQLSAEQQHQLERISKLKNEYNVCMEKFRYKQRTLNHNDIYQEQVINSELAKCTSIRNEHNSLVGTFNRSIEN